MAQTTIIIKPSISMNDARRLVKSRVLSFSAFGFLVLISEYKEINIADLYPMAARPALNNKLYELEAAGLAEYHEIKRGVRIIFKEWHVKKVSK